RYHDVDPAMKAFGGRVVVTLNDGSVVEDEIAVADAHPMGRRPFQRAQYVEKLHTLADGTVDETEIQRFLDVVGRLPTLGPKELAGLSLSVDSARLGQPAAAGVFDWRGSENG